jgi:hypothetical protein
MIDAPVTPDTEPSPRTLLDRRGALGALGVARFCVQASSFTFSKQILRK